MQKTNINMLKEGSILSESSHYIVLGTPVGGAVTVKHVESNTNVRLGLDYIKELIDSGDQYITEVKVGKEDKFWTQKQIDDLIAKEGIDYVLAQANGKMPLVGDVLQNDSFNINVHCVPFGWLKDYYNTNLYIIQVKSLCSEIYFIIV